MEFSIFSFFVSLLSVFTGNDTVQFQLESTTPKTVNILKVMTDKGRNHTFIPVTTTALPKLNLETLCPEEANSSDFSLLSRTRYHNDTKRCYTVPSQGPCTQNMGFYAENEMHGECACQLDSRLLIYNKKTNQCYYIFQQGYCSKTQWLDITSSGKPICTRNPCTSKKDLVQLKNKCVEVGKFAVGCDIGEVVGFLMNKRLPTCVSLFHTYLPRAMGVPSTPCNFGSVMAMDGRCSFPFDFD